MICLAGNHLTEDTISSIINLIVNCTELIIYSVFKLFLSLKNNYNKEGLAKVAIYTIGEFGDLLVSNSVIGPENDVLKVKEHDVLNVFKQILDDEETIATVREYIMNALAKLSNKFSEESNKLIYSLIEGETKSYYSEVQQRAVEYTVFKRIGNKDLEAKVLKNIPVSNSIKTSNENNLNAKK